MERRGSSGAVSVPEPLGALGIGYDITDPRAKIELDHFVLGFLSHGHSILPVRATSSNRALSRILTVTTGHFSVFSLCLLCFEGICGMCGRKTDDITNQRRTAK